MFFHSCKTFKPYPRQAFLGNPAHVVSSFDRPQRSVPGGSSALRIQRSPTFSRLDANAAQGEVTAATLILHRISMHFLVHCIPSHSIAFAMRCFALHCRALLSAEKKYQPAHHSIQTDKKTFNSQNIKHTQNSLIVGSANKSSHYASYTLQ